MIKYKVFILVSASLFFGYSPPANAANVYLGPDSACSASATGADWTNCKRFTEIAANGWGRGNTYYLQEGSYGSLTVTTPNSSDSRIIIKKCGANGQTQYGSGDGTCENASGFTASEHDGQANFSGAFSLQSGYVSLDGVTGGGPTDFECGNCGLLFNSTSGIGYNSEGTPLNPDGIIIQHTEIDIGCDTNTDDRGMTIWYANNTLLQYIFLHRVGCDLISGGGWNDLTIQYSKLGPNYQDPEGCHGDTFEHQSAASTNVIIRWNFF